MTSCSCISKTNMSAGNTKLLISTPTPRHIKKINDPFPSGESTHVTVLSAILITLRPLQNE